MLLSAAASSAWTGSEGARHLPTDAAQGATRLARAIPFSLGAFFRDYYHVKSADWEGNEAHSTADRPLEWSAPELGKLPGYYVMDLAMTMVEQVAAESPTQAFVRDVSSRWFTDEDVAVYAQEYGRTGFQGGLNGYRGGSVSYDATAAFAGAELRVPSAFIGGNRDVGVVQSPGALARVEAAPGYLGTTLIVSAATVAWAVTVADSDDPRPRTQDSAGHWVQQEQPEAVVERLAEILKELPRTKL